MIFELELIDTFGAERVFLNLISRQPHSFGKIRALVDTGSPNTIISAKDCYLLNLPITGAEKGEPITGFGKGGIPSKKMRKFSLALKSSDNKIKDLNIPINVVDITALKSMPEEYSNHVYSIPTIIGMDFLRLANLKLVVDIPNKKAYLESAD